MKSHFIRYLQYKFLWHIIYQSYPAFYCLISGKSFILLTIISHHPKNFFCSSFELTPWPLLSNNLTISLNVLLKVFNLLFFPPGTSTPVWSWSYGIANWIPDMSRQNRSWPLNSSSEDVNYINILNLILNVLGTHLTRLKPFGIIRQ